MGIWPDDLSPGRSHYCRCACRPSVRWWRAHSVVTATALLALPSNVRLKYYYEPHAISFWHGNLGPPLRRLKLKSYELPLAERRRAGECNTRALVRQRRTLANYPVIACCRKLWNHNYTTSVDLVHVRRRTTSQTSKLIATFKCYFYCFFLGFYPTKLCSVCGVRSVIHEKHYPTHSFDLRRGDLKCAHGSRRVW